MRKIVLFFLVLCSLLTLMSGACLAKIESYRDSIKGPFANGTTYTYQDPNYSQTYTIHNPVQNTVALRVLDNVLISSAFTCTLSLRVDYYTYATNTLTTVYPSLTVNYAAGQGVTYKGLDIYSFQGAYKIQVTVLSSTYTGSTPPANSLQLTSDIVIDRTYAFNSTQVIGAAYTWATNGKQLQATWTPVSGAEEYDVEWTTINTGNSNFALLYANLTSHSSPNIPAVSTALAQCFRNNGSRITTRKDTCTLSVLSTDSLLLVRIRQAQYDPVSGVRVTGNWDYTNGIYYAMWVLNWNGQTQNWQYSAAFAEDGKKKEVISYFDGTLRGRQTVTINNSDNVALAQENIYDDFGRPSASILPAGYKEPSYTPYLHYIPNFNVVSAGTPYTFANVSGTTPAVCEFNPDPLSTLAGASRYYSNQNDFISLNLNNKYIPDAAGYPLSVTQYTNDNTGRIRSQGGVGLAFQPGKSGSPALSKTTKYYYGKPEQWELDQLFGNDAGYAEHYLKNTVVDPNGQISVSYLNASGKTIATALAGLKPASLDTLTSYKPLQPTGKPRNLHILKPEQFIFNGTGLTLNAGTTYLATATGPDTLKFNMQKLIDYYPGGTFQVCSNCYYTMTAKVSDDCGNTIAAITTPLPIGSATANPLATGLFTTTLVAPIAAPGEYNVNIRLAFDNNVIQAYTDSMISKGIQSGYLEQQFGYIKKRYLDSIDVSACYSDCHTCKLLLGTKTNFAQMLRTKCISLGLDSVSVSGAPFTAWANQVYAADSAKCQSLQAGCSYDPCTSIQNVMQADVSPGGQYALFDSSGNALEPAANVITEILPGATQQNWRVVFPVLSPTNPVYQANAITLPDGTTTSPNDAGFNVQQLIAYWQPGWATSFLVYHPEYCRLQYCMSNTAYESWDMIVQQDIPTATAVANIPTGGAPPLSYAFDNPADWLMAGDPFFQTGGPGHSYASQMNTDLAQYSVNVLGIPNTSQHPTRSAMAYMDMTLYCLDTLGNMNNARTIPDTPWTHCTPNPGCRVADREWALYQQYYFTAKQKYYTLLRNSSCAATQPCVIGQPLSSSLPGACPAITDFSVQLYTGASACTGTNQTVVVVHNAGSLSQTTTVTLYYPPLLDADNLVHNITFAAGQSQATICVPAAIPVTSIQVNGVYCPSYPYGNDPSYVVTVVDQAGGTLNNDCSNPTFVQRNTVITLKDSYGNPVNAVSPVTATINYNITTCTNPTPQVLAIPLTIPVGQSTSRANAYVSLLDCIVPCHWGTKTIDIGCVQSLTNASNVTGLPTCTGYTYSNPQPPSGSCPAAYTVKIPRFPDATSNIAAQATATTVSTQLTNPANAAVTAQAGDVCTAMSAGWISRLQPGLTAMGATPTQISQLTTAFITICSSGGDLTHPMGASTLPLPLRPGATDTTFGAAIKRILLGGGMFTTTLNPWLIDAPYPYRVKQQSVPRTISRSDTGLCSLIGRLTTAAGGSSYLYSYLVTTYGSAMTLSTSDLTMLQNSCSTCKFLLATDVTLPVFLDVGAAACISYTAYQNAKTALVVQFGGTLPTTDPNYQTIFANYMNQQWGFSLTYADYAAYDASHPGLLCNTMPYTTIAADPNDCVKNAIAKAVIDGLADYNAYIANQRQLFKASYIGTCRLAQANANLNGLQQQYHYTLYYYDQADNLSRTIPPEGVTLFDASLFGYIDRARDNDTAAYAYTYNGPTTASDLNTALTTLSNTLSTSVGSVEMWLYNNSTSNYHWVEATPDRKYLFQVGLSGSKLAIDVYPMVQPTANSIQLVPASAHYQADISGLLPLPPFAHVVFQGSSLGAGTSLPQLYLNGTQLTVSNTSAPSPFGFNITAGSTSVTFPDSIYSLKHLRLYTHLLTQATITADASNAFFNATDLTYTGWYRFNVPAPGTPPTTINASTSDETNIIDTYPTHVLPTTYAYNSTNQVTQQNSPDGGTNSFWYDLLSRLTISQNDKQLAGSNYSYTTYDVIGRITEVGQKNQTTVSIGSPDYLTTTTLTSFAAAGTNSQITDTYYDKPMPTVSGHTNGIASLPAQSYLRKRVAANTYTETQGSPVLRATYYNYDLDGNVKTLWQQVDGLYINSSNSGLKRVDYEYDLVSGKVNTVRYQDGQPDAFYYSYQYDADNRLTKAYSSVTAMVDTALGSYLPASIRKLDAIYYYYLHGPLRREVIGNDSAGVQGVDYAYTLQGWLKGVNSTAATAAMDMGQDGADLSHKVARDAYGYSLGYYTGDYAPIGGTGYPAFALQYTASTGDITGQSLYNGNISNATLAINQLSSPVGYTYHYDQLNRLKKMRQHTGISGTSWDRHSITPNYQENVTYDGNGNILTYGRNGAAPTSQTIDSLTYNYSHSGNRLINNRLNSINDAIANSNYSLDLTNQTNPTNYRYDAIGNLIYDAQSGITGNDGVNSITWSVYGKILNIYKTTGTISYTYNPAGERVSKTVADVTTFYIRDAQGNTLALYDNKSSNVNWREQHLYGSSRIGMWTPNINLSTGNSLTVWDTTGHKQYELTNHLGNVLETVTEKRLQHTTSGTSIDYYLSDVATAQDYYPGGMLMPGRTFNTLGRYGFNGKENDSDIKGAGNQYDYGNRIYDPRGVRFLSVDPLFRKYPELSTYQFASNNPIEFIDVDGLEKALPRHQLFDPFSQLDNDVRKLMDKKVQRFEVKLSSMTDEEINKLINKTVSNVIMHPDRFITGAAKDLDKQGDELRDDGFKLLYLLASGQNSKAEKLTAKMIVQFGPAFLIPEEKEVEATATAPELFGYESTFKGGAKGDLLTGRVEKSGVLEGHHLPAYDSYVKASLEMGYDDASAIQMLFGEHRGYLSTGSAADAVAFRQTQANLMKQGKFMEAFDLDVREIRKAYGNKYDRAIKEAREYYQKNIVPKLEKQIQTN